MQAEIAPLVEIYKTNSNIFLHALSDISEDDMARRPDENTNNLLYIAGHMLTSRIILGQMLGMKEEVPFDGKFGRGEPLRDKSEYPGIDEITNLWISFSEKLLSQMEAVDQNILSAKAPYEFPIGDKTITGGVAFMALHEACHIGQIGMIRKMFGYSSIAG